MKNNDTKNKMDAAEAHVENTRYRELLSQLEASKSKVAELECSLVAERQNSCIETQNLKSMHAEAVRLIHEQYRQSADSQTLKYTSIIENIIREKDFQLSTYMTEKSQLQLEIQECKNALNDYSMKLNQASQDIHRLKSMPLAVKFPVLVCVDPIQI